MYCCSNSNVTFGTFSNNTSTITEYHQEYHTGPSSSIEFKVLFCIYVSNACDYFIATDYNLLFSNCSFDKNIIKYWYFRVINNKEIRLKGCYLDISNPISFGSVIITENVPSIYRENDYFSNTCLYRLFKQTDDEGIKLNNERKNNYIFMIFLASLNSS